MANNTPAEVSADQLFLGFSLLSAQASALVPCSRHWREGFKTSSRREWCEQIAMVIEQTNKLIGGGDHHTPAVVFAVWKRWIEVFQQQFDKDVLKLLHLGRLLTELAREKIELQHQMALAIKEEQNQMG